MNHPNYATSNYGWALWHLEQIENAAAPDVALVHTTAANARAALAAIDHQTSFGGSTWTVPPTREHPTDLDAARVAAQSAAETQPMED